MIVGTACQSGCSDKRSNPTDHSKTEVKKTIDPPDVIDITRGTAKDYGDHGEPLWTVRWQTGALTTSHKDPKSNTTGALRGVDGEIYDHEKIACTFRSRIGHVDKEKKILTLDDQVQTIAKDPATALHCDHLAYDGNEKFFKAKGNVSVLGTMRTMGTIDEVWATPDHLKIATPDLFSSQSLPIAPPDRISVWTNDRGLTVASQSWKMTEDSSRNRFFALRKSVAVASSSEGVTLNSGALDLSTVPDPKEAKVYKIRQAIADTDVVFVKKASSPNGIQTTRLTGSKAIYHPGAHESVVSVSGPVTITSVDPLQRQTLVATGSSGVVSLAPNAKVSSGDGLRNAQLEGPVHIDFGQAASSKQSNGTAIVATCSRVLFDNIGNQRRITMIGNVHVLGPGPGDNARVGRATCVFDRNRQWRLEALSQ